MCISLLCVECAKPISVSCITTRRQQQRGAMFHLELVEYFIKELILETRVIVVFIMPLSSLSKKCQINNLKNRRIHFEVSLKGYDVQQVHQQRD